MMGEETRGWSGLVNPNILVGRLDEMKLYVVHQQNPSSDLRSFEFSNFSASAN